MNNEQVNEFDVVITGAGPAGCAAALSLRNSGLRVALIDKSIFPRDKVCGDAIPTRAIKTLKAISPELATAFPDFNKQLLTRRTSVVYNNKNLELYWKIPAYTCPRLHFDNWLMEQVTKTDTAILQETRITSVEPYDESIILKDSNGIIYKAALVIGTDGAQSITAKILAGRTINRDHHIGAVRAYYSGVNNVASDCTEIYIDKRYLPGYFWIFPVADDMVNVGFGMISSDVAKNKTDLKKSLTDFIDITPGLKERFAGSHLQGEIRGFSLPLGSRRVNMSGNRFMLAGDAASLIDPISGDGIGNAILSGHLAALHAKGCFRDNNFTATYMQQYDNTVWQKLGKELTTHYRGQRLLREVPFLLNPAFSLASYEPVRRFLQKFF